MHPSHRICVVGAGPAGFYLADAVLRRLPHAAVDILERLPVPQGLVRHGVAPDHPEVKAVSGKCQEVLDDPRVTFAGGVRVGNLARGAVDLARLRSAYDAVALCHGAGVSRGLGIEGEEDAAERGTLLSAAEVVAAYNSDPIAAVTASPRGNPAPYEDGRCTARPERHPEASIDHLRPLLSARRVHVIGHGNVGIDIARVLLGGARQIRGTDVSPQFLRALEECAPSAREVCLVGRRGPLQSAFTTAEFREMLALEGVTCTVEPGALELSEETRAGLRRPRRRLLDAVAKCAVEPATLFTKAGEDPHVEASAFRTLFHRIPHRIDPLGHAISYELSTVDNETGIATATGETVTHPVDAVVASVGYISVPCDSSLPIDPRTGLVPNHGGRVLWNNEEKTNTQENEQEQQRQQNHGGLAPVFVAGWLRHGPRGTILTTMMDAKDVAEGLVESVKDINGTRREGILAALASCDPIDNEAWKRIDTAEREAGAAAEGGAVPRVKFETIADQRAAAAVADK